MSGGQASTPIDLITPPTSPDVADDESDHPSPGEVGAASSSTAMVSAPEPPPPARAPPLTAPRSRKRRTVGVKRPRSAPAAGTELVGRVIEVYWPLDDAWYAGRVEQFGGGRHTVVYIQDGEGEKLLLSSQKWRVAEPAAVTAAEAVAAAVKEEAKAAATATVEAELSAAAVALHDGACVLADVSRGRENRPLPLRSIEQAQLPAAEAGGVCAALAAMGRFTYVPCNLNRTLMDVEGGMLPELLERTVPEGLLPRLKVAERLRPCHREPEYLFTQRQRASLKAAMAEVAGGGEAGGDGGEAGVDGDDEGGGSSSAAVPTYGCGKCRWGPKGCARCRAEGFVPGKQEGLGAGGIPRPGCEGELAVVGTMGDGGGLLQPVIVTDATPICGALREAGLPPGVGLVAAAPIRTGEAVVEYVGEILTREQSESREAWYAEQDLVCSYPLFTEMHGFVIDATLYGNAARFMNASCTPNLKPAKMIHDQGASMPRVLFRAVRDIRAGEELTWRYHAAGDTTRARHDQASNNESQRARPRRQSEADAVVGHVRCFCGSAKCGGWL